MRAVFTADFFDTKEMRLRIKGEAADLPAARIDEINAAFPGIVEKQQAKKNASRKEA